jgi:methyl-accepting chemotaxis protein
MTVEMQTRMGDLAMRTNRIQVDLEKAKGPFSDDLHQQLRAMQARSAQQRSTVLACFAVTLLIAGLVVNLTIRRSITGPISRVIHGVQGASDQTAQASDRMAESGQVVARDAREQAACIEETSASLEQISAATRQNAERAREADQLMREARKTVEGATAAMQDLTESMDTICNSSKQVSDVLKSIDEISFHTNILALNAAIEAARAGEVGAGFSVVADEVRFLAKRAAEAAGRSADIIEKTIQDVNKGAELVALAQCAFNQVSVTIASGSRVVSEISSSSEEQSRGVTHIGTAVARMGTVTQNNAINAHQTAEAASEMTVQVQTTRKHLAELAAVLGV